MSLSVTSIFSGKAAGFYISAALKETRSLDYLTLIENIKFKSNIQRMAGSSVVRDATCDFTDHGTLAMTEKVLEPKNLQINLDLCKTTLLSSWEALDRDYKEPLSAGRVHLVSETNYHTTDIIKNISSTPKGDPAYAGNCC